ncbi:LysR substrate-binding domain-containing protein [Aminobacter sp. P9b]|uniref:LysR family transcriptional regulator n=1 Tax=Aminobacter sp. P9b TaxID=3133697 RepID=UPI003246BA41
MSLPMRPTLRQIRSFKAVVELGNFSRAAESMQTSQANLSHTIRDLELVLGARLFDRTTRRVDMTDAGRAFATGALAGLNEIDRAAEYVRDLSSLKRGLVRIAAPPLIAGTILPRVLREVAAAHSELVLRIEDVSTDIIVEQVRSGRCDLGVGTFSPGEAGLDSQPGLQDSLMVFCTPDDEFAGRQQIRWAELRDHQIITLTRESSIRLLTEFGFESAGLPLRPQLEVHQINTALSLAENGAGIAILPAYSLAALKGRSIVARPLVEPAIVREVRLVTARDRAPSAATIATRNILRRVLREMVPEVV